MEALGKILLFIVIVLVLPTALIYGGWFLIGFMPEVARGAIAVLVPYAIILAVWVFLAWLCLSLFAAMVD